MYEFFDAHGERVTVRSARTLERLLGEGQITATTRFRRSDESDFTPAAGDAELREIADRLGIRFGPLPAAEEATTVAVVDAPEVELPDAAMPAVMAPATRAKALPSTDGTAATRAIPRAGTPMVVSAKSPWLPPQPTPAPRTRAALGASPNRTRTTTAGDVARRIGVAFLHHAAAGFAGFVAGAIVIGITGNTGLFALGVLGGSGLAGYFAANRLAARPVAISDREVCVASALFGVACLVLTGGPGLVVAAPVCVGLWLERRRQRP